MGKYYQRTKTDRLRYHTRCQNMAFLLFGIFFRQRIGQLS